MNEYYKKLMEQHGGYIPFSVLGDYKKNKRTKRVKKQKRTKRMIKFTNTTKYAPGTILRKNNRLYKLNSLKKWIKI